MQPASTLVMYSPGRWNVYSCSLRASSKMTVPTSIDSRRAAHRRGHVEDLRAQVDGRHGEAVDLAAAARHVQLVDAGRARAQLLRRLPDDPARGVDDVLVRR